MTCAWYDKANGWLYPPEYGQETKGFTVSKTTPNAKKANAGEAEVEAPPEPKPDPNPTITRAEVKAAEATGEPVPALKLAVTDPPPEQPEAPEMNVTPAVPAAIKRLIIVSDGNVVQTALCEFNNLELDGIKAWLATQRVTAKSAPAE